MKSLITPVEVLRHAFGGGEVLPTDTITEADIAAAEERYLRPMLGQALYERLLEGDYDEFRTNYLVTCTALFTRLVVQSRLDIRTARIGSLAPKSDNGTAADETSLRCLRHNLRNEANTLLRRALRHLEAHRAEYPEYDCYNPLFHRCTTDGGFVQIR